MYASLGKYVKAREHLEKSLTMHKGIGDRNETATSNLYISLGAVYRSIDGYEKAREHLKKSVAIAKKIGDRNDLVPLA